MNKTTLNSQKEKHFMLSLRRATPRHRRCTAFRTYFYPRPPCGERLTNKRLDERERNFYPRSPCGERPTIQPSPASSSRYFYPRSPCGERRGLHQRQRGRLQISIHALLAESDPPMVRIHFFPAISIHALLAESDDRRRSSAAAFSDFYPRSPCGERRVCADLLGVATGFLSTLSLRRATAFSATCPWA